jgi:4-amino-4-deoxy-L-arabinose transferase-like glycosyltransferase
VLLVYGLSLVATVAGLLAVRVPIHPRGDGGREEAGAGPVTSGQATLTLLCVGLIVAVGLLLRTYHTEQAPPAVFVDEAANGNDALSALASGDYRWFYPANSGREGLFINLVALCFAWLGSSVLALRLPAIVASTLTILGVFLLGRELLNRRIGLLSALLVAVSFWPIAMGRLGLRANLLPLILVFSFWALLRGLRRRSLPWCALAGIIFGVGLHSYIAWRVAPLVLIVTGAALAISRRSLYRTHWAPILAFAVASLVVALPMISTFCAHPDYFLFRSRTVSVFSAELNHGSPLATLLRSIFLSLAKYTSWGARSWRFGLPPYPLLDPLTAAFFLCGLVVTLARVVASLGSATRAATRDDERGASLLVAAWFFVMLFPEFLSAEDVPHNLRAIGTLPVVFVLAAIPLDLALRRASGRSVWARRAAVGVISLCLAIVGVLNPAMYFLVWAKQPETALAFDKKLTDISAYLDSAPPGEKYFVIGHDSLARLPIKIFHPEPTNVFVYEDELDRIVPRSRRGLMIFLIRRNPTAIRTLQERFPDLALVEQRSGPGSRFYVMR